MNTTSYEICRLLIASAHLSNKALGIAPRDAMEALDSIRAARAGLEAAERLILARQTPRSTPVPIESCAGVDGVAAPILRSAASLPTHERPE